MLRLIPGLENATFLRYGQIHRNTYINSPTLLTETLQLRAHPSQVLIAGQLSGVRATRNPSRAACSRAVSPRRSRAASSRHPRLACLRTDRSCTTSRTPRQNASSRQTSPSTCWPPLEEELRKKIRDKKERHRIQCETRPQRLARLAWTRCDFACRHAHIPEPVGVCYRQECPVMTCRLRASILVLLCCVAGSIAVPAQTVTGGKPAWQQAAGNTKMFEVASVRQDNGPFQLPSFALSDDDWFRDPSGRFHADFGLPIYIQFAYKLHLTGEEQKAVLAKLPDWVRTDRFLIQATAPLGATKDQYRLMMQALLADPFRIAAPSSRHTRCRC